MKKLLLLIPLFFMFSCAHHHKGTAHHHDALEKHCAYSVSEGDMHTMGKDEFTFEHGGETYYFSSEEKREKFKKNLSHRILNAKNKWENRNQR